MLLQENIKNTYLWKMALIFVFNRIVWFYVAEIIAIQYAGVYLGSGTSIGAVIVLLGYIASA